MYCNNCKKEVEETLELFDGTFACAICKNKINVGELKIDAVGEEQFVLAEIMFHNSLTITDNKVKRRAIINRALALTKLAAFHGHPKAVIRLGYYYEMGYVKVDAVQGFKMACQYYRTVWTNTFEEASLRDYVNLRQIAASRHLALLEHTPPQLKLDVEHYGYDKVGSEMVASGALSSRPHKASGVSDEELDDALRISGILNTCLNKARPSLFGIIALTGSAIRNWANGEVLHGKKTEKRYALYAREGVELYLLWSKNNHYRHLVGEHSLAEKDSTGNLLLDDETYYLCFLNGSVKRYGAVKKLLTPEGANADLLFALVNTANGKGYADYVFYGDDVQFYRSKGETIKHATKDLIEAVCNNK